MKFKPGAGEYWPQWMEDAVKRQIGPTGHLILIVQGKPSYLGAEIGEAIANKIDKEFLELLN